MGRTGLSAMVLPLVLAAGGARANPAKNATFQSLGPAPIETDSHTNAGSVQAIAIDPTDKNTVWIGASNGGVWKTTDFHPGENNHSPKWVPLTDDQPSLSISGLSIDPKDASAKTVVASLGDQSSARSFHGPWVGVLRTTDGGAHWTPLGASTISNQDLTGVVARGAKIVVASRSATGGGVWRSTDTGATFTNVFAGKVASIVADPKDGDHLWIGATGANGGVYESPDTGKTWTKVSPAALDTHATASDAAKVLLSVQDYANGKHEVYAVIADTKPPGATTGSDIDAIFRLSQTNSGAVAWDDMEKAVLPKFETLDQGKVAIAGDPKAEDTFFVAGDEGRVFRCKQAIGATAAPNCRAISGANRTAHDTAPHADARKLVFDTDDVLVGTDDGGVYIQSKPRSDNGDWFSKNGDLAITETYACAYDPHADVAFCGTQDNGTVAQDHSTSTEWQNILGADGGVTAVSDALFTCPFDHSHKCSSRYFSHQQLANFTHEDCDGNNKCKVVSNTTNGAMLHLAGTSNSISCKNLTTTTACDAGLSERTPLAADRFDAERIAVAGDKLYESKDGGKKVSVVSGFTGTVSHAILFGGEKSGVENADLLLVASSDGLFARTAPGAVALTTWTKAAGKKTIEAIAVDRDDWSSVWVVTSKSTVWHGTDVTGTHETWIEITGDLAPGGPGAQDLNAIARVGGSNPYIVVGGQDGLYATSDLSHWFKLSGALPNAPVGTLQWSKSDDVLVIGTVGRGAWEIRNASDVFAPAVVHGTTGPNVPPAGPGHVNPGDPVEGTHEVVPVGRNAPARR